MQPVIPRGEKMFMYAIVGFIDILQFILSPFIFVNNAIDLAVAGGLIWYALHKKIFTANKGLVLAATFLVEQIPFVNALPFWTYDLHNLYKGTSGTPAETDMGDMPLNSGGVRRPTEKAVPMNSGGTRAPRKV